jgi:hypothetical protein
LAIGLDQLSTKLVCRVEKIAQLPTNADCATCHGKTIKRAAHLWLGPLQPATSA